MTALRYSVLFVAIVAGSSSAQVPADQAAKMLLDSARRAYNDKNYPFAAARFREFLQKYGGHRDAASARYGLALSLLDGPERNFEQAANEPAPLVGNKSPDQPFVLYHLGLSRRGQGLASLATAVAKPAEANQHKEQARSRFEDAGKQFLSAAVLFLERGKAEKDEKGLPVDLEWALRSRCDAAEMLLRQRKAKEARAALDLLVGEDAKKWQSSRYANLGLYQAGFADFLLGNYAAAGKLLSRAAIQDDEVFGTHARYLLARVHHNNSKAAEREEARTQYQAVLKGYEDNKKAAQDRLRQPVDPDTRARLEKLLRAAPDHVSRANFYLGVLQYEDGRFGEALTHFQAFEKQSPDPALLAEAKLRQGFCLVQSRDPKSLDDALKILQPIADKEPALADQAYFWIARAQVAKVDPAKGGKFDQALDTFRKAAGKAQERMTTDPGAKARRGEILAEQARTHQTAKQYREAANNFAQIAQEKLLPERDDEWSLDRATALQLAGDLAESEKECDRFLKTYKDSPLTAALLFRQAENSTFLAHAAQKNPNAAERVKQVAKYLEDAVARYSALIEKHPEAAHVAYARQGLGAAWYQKGDLAKAQAALDAVPVGDRNGDLAGVSYQLADILLRQCPAKAEDAVAAGKLEEKLKGAVDLLEAFVGAAADSPQAPDAMLKLGFCRQRQAAQIADRQAQQQAWAEARTVYERLLQKYPKSEAAPQGMMERAKVLARMNDINGAMNELRKFSADANLKKTTTAPMALLALATLQRGQNKPLDAAATLDDCLKTHQAALAGQPTRAWWVGLLQYHHAAALREGGKLDEARQMFDSVTRTSPTRPEGWDAAVRAGQSQKEQGEKRIAEGRKLLANAGLKPDQKAAAEKKISDGITDLRNAVAYFASQEATLRTRKVEGDDEKTLAATRSRLLYEAAWGWRAIADLEVADARRKIQQDRWQKRRDELSRGLPAGSPPPQVAVPDVALAEVSLQPGETQARNTYQTLIKLFPELAVNADARLELSELLAERGSHAEAAKLLQGALEGEKEPSADLTDKIKLRLGACLLDQGARKLIDAKKKLDNGPKEAEKAALQKQQADGRKDVEAGMEHLQAITSNEKSKVLHHAVYREAECLLQLGKTDDAIKMLARFRDLGPYQNIPGLSDRACLRLGYALAEKGQWDLCRQAYSAVIDRTGGNSPWSNEARYGIAWAHQNQARYDDAVNLYSQVASMVTTELAARSQLNVGLCRLLQKRYGDAATALLVVPFTYEYPELSAMALVEAARALHESKKTAQAVLLLKRVLRDYPGSPQAAAAQKRLLDLGEA